MFLLKIEKNYIIYVLLKDLDSYNVWFKVNKLSLHFGEMHHPLLTKRIHL